MIPFRAWPQVSFDVCPPLGWRHFHAGVEGFVARLEVGPFGWAIDLEPLVRCLVPDVDQFAAMWDHQG